MEFEKYTERSRGFFQAAKDLAEQSNHQQLTPLHLLKVLLNDKDGLGAKLIRVAGGKPEIGLKSVETELDKLACVKGDGAGQIFLSKETENLMQQSEQIAKKAGDKFVTAEKLLLAITVSKGTIAAKVLADAGVTVQNMNKAIENLRKGHTANSPNVEDTYDALNRYALDLTIAAAEGKIDPKDWVT